MAEQLLMRTYSWPKGDRRDRREHTSHATFVVLKGNTPVDDKVMMSEQAGLDTTCVAMSLPTSALAPFQYRHCVNVACSLSTFSIANFSGLPHAGCGMGTTQSGK